MLDQSNGGVTVTQDMVTTLGTDSGLVYSAESP